METIGKRVCGLLLAAIATAASVSRVAAQELPDLSRTAARLVDGVRGTATQRIALLPLSDGGAGANGAFLEALTRRLHAALIEAARPRAGSRVVIDYAESTQAVSQLRLPQPFGPASAALAGGLMGAEFVVVGHVAAARSGTDLQAQLIEVSSRRSLAQAAVAVVIPPTMRAPALAGPVPTLAPARPVWQTRRVAILAGFGSAAAASAFAVLKNNQVGRARERALALPPGATDAFNRELSAARSAERARNFLWGAAIGVTGVTLVYMWTSDTSGTRPQAGPVIARELPARWRLEVHPATLRVQVGRRF